MSREPIRIRISFNNLRCHKLCYGILVDVSIGYLPDTGKLLTRYAPFRRSPPRIAPCAAPRLACVKPAASVHPEPGSNSSLYNLSFFSIILWRFSLLLVGNILQYHLRYLGSFTFKDLIPSPTSPHSLTLLTSSFGIAKVLPFSILTKYFEIFFLLQYLNSLIMTKKNFI